MFWTVLSSRPPTEPIDRPWPPVHCIFVTTMLVPELIAIQSSWLYTVAPVIVNWSTEPMSNASVFLPREVPALLLRVTPLTVRPVESPIDHAWTGEFKMVILSICSCF